MLKTGDKVVFVVQESNGLSGIRLVNGALSITVPRGAVSELNAVKSEYDVVTVLRKFSALPKDTLEAFTGCTSIEQLLCFDEQTIIRMFKKYVSNSLSFEYKDIIEIDGRRFLVLSYNERVGVTAVDCMTHQAVPLSMPVLHHAKKVGKAEF